MSRKLTVGKPGGPPANPPQRSYLDFEKFMALEHDLCKFSRSLHKALDGLDENPFKGEWRAQCALQEMTEDKLRKNVEAYIKGAAWYERDELYETDEDGATHVRRHVIAEHVAALLGSFPVAPHSPEVFVRRMIEEIVVLDPWASDLEHGCRQMIRKSKFPDIATLMDTLQEDEGGSFIDEVIERDEETGEYQIIITYRELAAELEKAKLAIEEAKELEKPIRCNEVSRFKRGNRVSHLRYGEGDVSETHGKQIVVKFDTSGLHSVIDRFLEPVYTSAMLDED
jgi:hypothetical protein